MKNEYIAPLFALLLVGQVQGAESSMLQTIGEAYNLFLRDKSIRSWQNRVSDSANCAVFKARLEKAGRRHASAASGAYVMDMREIMEAVEAANCKYRS